MKIAKIILLSLFLFFVISIRSIFSLPYLPGKPTLVVLYSNYNPVVVYPKVLAYYNGVLVGEAIPEFYNDKVIYNLWLTLPYNTSNVQILIKSEDGVFQRTINLSEGDIVSILLDMTPLLPPEIELMSKTQSNSESSLVSTRTIFVSSSTKTTENKTIKNETLNKTKIENINIIQKKSYIIKTNNPDNRTINLVTKLLYEYYHTKFPNKQLRIIVECNSSEIYIEEQDNNYTIFVKSNIYVKNSTNLLDYGSVSILYSETKRIFLEKSQEIIHENPYIVLSSNRITNYKFVISSLEKPENMSLCNYYVYEIPQYNQTITNTTTERESILDKLLSPNIMKPFVVIVIIALGILSLLIL